MSWRDDNPPVFWEFTVVRMDENGLADGWKKITYRKGGFLTTAQTPATFVARFLSKSVRVMGFREYEAQT